MSEFTDAQRARFNSALSKTIIRFTNALYHPGNIDLISKEEMRDLLSSGQLESKAWLVDELTRRIHLFLNGKPAKVVTCGGWVGFLAELLNNASDNIEADSLDLNPDSTRIAQGVLWNNQAILGDMYAFDYAPYDVIINTAAEHIPVVQEWSDLIPKGKGVVVQSNDARYIQDHISCVDSVDELVKLLNLSEIHYMGSKKFSMYTRFMVIGKK